MIPNIHTNSILMGILLKEISSSVAIKTMKDTCRGVLGKYALFFFEIAFYKLGDPVERGNLIGAVDLHGNLAALEDT